MARRRRSADWDDWDEWGYFPPSRPLPADGIRAQSQRGEFARNWWARRWIEVMESYGWSSRLQRGRTYARAGQVLNIDVSPGLVKARVQGSRRTPYKVEIRVSPLKEDEWASAIEALAEQALYAAQLLAGEMPPEIEQVFGNAGTSLFPRVHDLRMSCSCPDFAVPCKHLAAVCYLLGEELDRDPFLLFALRGRSREQVMAALRERRAVRVAAAEPAPRQAEPPSAPTAEAAAEIDLAAFWQHDDEIPGVPISLERPTVETALLKRLGPPTFVRRPEAFMATLSLVYAVVTDRALELAFGADETSVPAEPADSTS